MPISRETRPHSRRSQHVSLTPRGERVLAALWACVITAGSAVLFLGMLGLAGWIEGAP